MRILIVGNGGREHALAWKLAQSPRCSQLFIAPGNPGTAALGTNLDIGAGDIDALVDFATEHEIDLTVVGPEQPLVDGLVDTLLEAGLRTVGPTAAAAQLEGSKAFAKQFMSDFAIPTAAYRTFTRDETEEARAYLEAHDLPVVVKASGLAAGKGALVCETRKEALDALEQIVHDDAFGSAGDQVVIEEFMRGEEASVFALCDGTHYVLLPPAQDHKRVGEGGTGPNTGGMGAYAPAPVVTGRVLTEVCRRVIEPTLAGMQDRGAPYTGVLYCGLMITDHGPKVVEFNCRLGDPEAQVVLPLLETDLVDLFDRLADRSLGGFSVRTRVGAAACVVMASGGYPGVYEKGKPIHGIDDAEAEDDVVVFQAGTAVSGGALVTDGGRVLGVTATGDDLGAALEAAYRGVDAISFDNAQFRRDIGQKGLARADAS